MLKDFFQGSKKGLIPFIMVGYPSVEESLKYSLSLIEEGVTALELGVPFSDPLADGPVIQKAAEVALQNGTDLNSVFYVIKEIKKLHPHFPLIIFTYCNPLFQMGFLEYATEAKSVGAYATLCVDLSIEESADFVRAHQAVGLDVIFLASPTTSVERLKKIESLTGEFIYYVSRLGVTGEVQKLSDDLASELRKLKSQVHKPLAVGFGISNPEQAMVVSKYAKIVVIGSRFLRMMEHPISAETEIRKLAQETMKAMNL